MAKSLEAWLEQDVAEVKDKPVSWLSQHFFFRDPSRPTFSNTDLFFSPADGVVLYQREVDPDEGIVDLKGMPYSLKDALRDEEYAFRSLVIGVFMTFYDVHINRIPFPGNLSWRVVEPIDTLNRPMLEVEKSLVEDLRVSLDDVEYLHTNQRVVNRIDAAPYLDEPYHLLQLADYDVDSITPFELRQNQPAMQGSRFSQIRYGSQVDLVIPLSERYTLTPLQEVGHHVEAGLDPLVQITPRKD